MRVLIVTPAPPRSLKGNRITALRWARLLRRLGHRVAVEERFEGGRYDLLIALHARRSHHSLARWRAARPDHPALVVLTGTDVYDEIHRSPEARQSLEWASRLVVLQPLAIPELPEALRPKARVVFQSVELPPSLRDPARRPAPRLDPFEVCVVGHLRPVKDPFRAAAAARLLPSDSRIRVAHVGAALSEEMAARARAEMAGNPRYRWLGERPRAETLRILARSRAMVLSSRLEGGANVISEAVALSVPVLATAIPGSIGLLGEGYPGYFRVEDTRGLARLLHRVESDPEFLRELRRRCEERSFIADPARELQTIRELLEEVRR